LQTYRLEQDRKRIKQERKNKRKEKNKKKKKQKKKRKKKKKGKRKEKERKKEERKKRKRKKNRICGVYLGTVELCPSLLIEFHVEVWNRHWINKIDEEVSNIALILTNETSLLTKKENIKERIKQTNENKIRATKYTNRQTTQGTDMSKNIP
jgi:hypothetical protein